MGWIQSIANGINKTFNAIRPAFPMIPAILLVCEAAHRPGLSAIALASAIIQRLPEVGIETGVNCDGSPNKITGKAYVEAQEIVNHFKKYGGTRVGIAPGELNLVVNGMADPSGHVTGFATNIQPIGLKGIIF